MNKTLQQSVKNLEELFDLFNDYFYNSELERPIISIQADKTGHAYGWCTTYKAWSTKDGEEYYEINLCAEYMTRNIYEVCGTLLHEMAHLYNLTHDIKDCNAGHYHNRKFKEAAEAHGLECEKTKYGWSKTRLNQFSLNIVSQVSYEFDIARKQDPMKTKIKTPGKKKYHSYTCPCCKIKVYGIYEMNLTCNDCGEQMIEY